MEQNEKARYKKWFPFTTYDLDELNNRDIVFCFHHAGGSASVYRKWTLKKEKINFVCVELPGKGTRRKERFIENFEELVGPLVESIINVADDRNILFFGHSMGAAMAFYAAAYMAQNYGREPRKIVVAGRQAPNEVNLTEFKSYMDDDALIKELIRYQATILFVHGAYHAAWCWEEHFIPFFYAHGYNVYAMSFRNHGNSERIENVDQIVVKDMVEDLIKTIDMIDGKIILIAHSLGCRIAQMCLEEIYSSIQSVVLITPMPVRNNFLQLLQMSKKQRKNNLEYILFSERLDSERKEYYMSLLDKESKKVEYAMMKRQKKFSIYVRKIPTLVIGSYNDQCVILQAVKDNAKIHTAELKIVDSVCHDMMLDPDWRNIADLIFKFIEKTIDKKSGDNYNDNYVSTQAHQGGE